MNLPTLLPVGSRHCRQTWQLGTLELESPGDLKGRPGFPFAFMFYECWGNVGCLLIIKAVFYDFPKGKQKKKGKVPSILLSGQDKRLTFPALRGPRGSQPWKIRRRGSVFRKAKGFEVGSRWGLLSPVVRRRLGW